MKKAAPRVYFLPLVLVMAALPSTAGDITFDVLPTGTMAPARHLQKPGSR